MMSKERKRPYCGIWSAQERFIQSKSIMKKLLLSACPTTAVRFCLLMSFVALLPVAARADWQAVEKVETYAIAGKTGPELYASIGERGPKIGNNVRVIAHTNFKLTWSRNYQADGGACTLVSVRPNLVITYSLPKPAEKLPPAMARKWETFITGVRNHEDVHGGFIKDMVRKIELATAGLSVADDPKCQKIRVELTRRLSEISQFREQQNRDFDRTELSDGGNVQQLILALVNEPQGPALAEP
jgi:predicted secreted Zn-dependent protease